MERRWFRSGTENWAGHVTSGAKAPEEEEAEDQKHFKADEPTESTAANWGKVTPVTRAVLIRAPPQN
ncbi:hypothetical protein PG990_007846 [Apiospora arundinis]